MSPQITKELVVWDPLIRIFHWSLTFFFFLAYLLEGDWPALHSHAGYTVALLIIFRMVWGMIGSMHARFSDFITTPSIALTYFKRLLTSKNETYIGHNPAGAAMILALMTCLLITAFSGISLFAMEGSGPLANTIVASWSGYWLEEVHDFFANFTLFLIVLHTCGVLFTSYRSQENLTRAMITGRKRRVSKSPGE
ncbi:MAG TPA: cytochrome b/b6 domain-containing protein [Pseudomonadales bacterium]|jgi:cytochrome b|nr:cytochrome b/b6 domain-containing protein [Pseudomonadales bacterium]MDP6315305.1 cytochrome b/b6 domain-containing protein [Pseudomonadales bacterium]MDP7314753.1 cytochrome b/b6 domain-containing protein [Pseudomonadales bacterium]MDP7576625.1 cytochrome b/b6 domain-containing protein [Pseudomonadales bacterium]HJL60379.1 cytochrome b/b6 domain-containing protein [Pseudomonadales bacterium]|tara:strand:+ start:7932 stop:8516 length:585 start_codon:yes stop_codon:yes gene_type:complete